MTTKARVKKDKYILYPSSSLANKCFEQDFEHIVYLVVEVHGVGHVVAELGGVEAVVAGHLVVAVELASLLPRLIYHIVVDVRVIR